MQIIGKIRFLLLSLKINKKFMRGCLGEKSTIKLEKNGKFIFNNKFNLGAYSTINIRNKAKLNIGEKFATNKNVYIACRYNITIGENALIGPNVIIVDNNHDYMVNDFKTKYYCKEIVIGKNVWIGANVIILPGSTIGNNVVIGAGTIISGKIPDNVIVYTKQSLTMKEYARK